jgi:RP/EB family microtubule-associated protein
MSASSAQQSFRLTNRVHRDNLEFLQWIKRFWESNYSGRPYDPVAGRTGAPAALPATMGAMPVADVAVLHEQNRELTTHTEGLQKERDFYLAKVG